MVVVARALALEYRKQQTQTACHVMGFSASGYFVHWRRKNANKRISDEALVARGTPTEAHILKWRRGASNKARS
ncbi:MAG: hypothetical protein HHJ16_00615 [Polaromonas sp.]|uniref:hypothetical protein n=1 Tax=Polaromonas sp. TaxID=1869339 RepID=UPI0018344886|nr:hypothetical protein [Polaromonas sp.]NMM08767.1 hypothetical protein [Polaromonas sp.]